VCCVCKLSLSAAVSSAADVVNCCSPDDEYIAAGSSDGGVYIWQVTTSKLHSVLKDHRYHSCQLFCLLASSHRVATNLENLEYSGFL